MPLVFGQLFASWMHKGVPQKLQGNWIFTHLTPKRLLSPMEIIVSLANILLCQKKFQFS
jgi:hypothetical protein